MNINQWAFVMSLLLLAGTCQVRAVGTAFTYQGKLTFSGQPAAATYDFECRLFDAPAAGNQVGSLITPGSIEADEQGVFTMTLDFGIAAFSNGADRWLELGVRESGSGQPFTPLTPRQKVTAAPFALFAERVGLVSDSSLAGTYSNPLTLNNAANVLSGNGGLITGINAANISAGVLANARLSGAYTGTLSLTNPANFLAGNGVNVTNLSASQLTTGTVPGARLSGTYPNALTLGNAANTFTGTFNGTFIGDGAGLNSLNAANITAGSLSPLRLPAGGNWPLTSQLTIDTDTISIDPVNGRIGLGTTSPTDRLHIEGNLRVDGDIEIPTTPRSMGVSGSTFSNIEGTAVQFDVTGWWIEPDASVAAGQPVSAHLHVHLPQGALVTSMSIVVDDTDTQGLTVSLRNQRFSDGDEQATLSSISTSGTPGKVTLTDTTIGAAVDNNTFAYLLRFSANGRTNVANRLRLYVVRINYEIDTPLP